MTDNYFFVSEVVTIIFFVIKFIEMRFIDKENKPLKHLVRDSAFVFSSVLLALWIIEQVKPFITEELSGDSGAGHSLVFTDTPTF